MKFRNIPSDKYLNSLIVLILIVSILAVYLQTYNYSFINHYDDEQYITKNEYVTSGLSWKNIIWALSTTYASNWHPITWISHMIDVELFGTNAGMHHLVNVFFHIFNTILIFIIFKKMTRSSWNSFFVALLFALHPLHVESVAWIAERKDVLSTFFWMLTMFCYLRYVEHSNIIRYLLVIIPFILGLMSKPMLVTLPFILLLIDYWPLQRYPWQMYNTSTIRRKDNQLMRLIGEKIFLVIISAASCTVTMIASMKGGAVISIDKIPVGLRISNAFVSYIIYVGKTLIPFHLGAHYSYNNIIPLWKSIGAFIVMGSVSVFVLRMLKKSPYLAVGWFWYLGTLVPVIGLIQVGQQSMADRYTYIPLIGLFIMITWGISELVSSLRFKREIIFLTSLIVFLILIITTQIQISYWGNDLTLFKHAVEVAPDDYTSQHNLGSAFFSRGNIDEAKDHYLKALALDSRNVELHYSLGIVSYAQGNIEEAIQYYTKALQIYPYHLQSLNNLGALLLQQGKYDDAIFCFQKVFDILPNEIGRNNLNAAITLKRIADIAINSNE